MVCFPDERAILFEKQRLRLRKAFQSVSMPSHSPAPGSVQISLNRAGGTYSPDAPPLTMAALNSSISSGREFDIGGSTAQSGEQFMLYSQARSSASGGGVGRGVPGTSLDEFSSTSAINFKLMGSTKKGPPPPAPIYAWEVSSSSARTGRRKLVLDGMHFLPTDLPGMYAREDEVDADIGELVTLPEKFVDFQIILTADEISALISRTRIASRSDIHDPKNAMMASSVHAAHPFVDSTRLMQDYFRTKKPEKWVHRGDLRAARK